MKSSSKKRTSKNRSVTKDMHKIKNITQKLRQAIGRDKVVEFTDERV